jgi:hypothetical protein
MHKNDNGGGVLPILHQQHCPSFLHLIGAIVDFCPNCGASGQMRTSSVSCPYARGMAGCFTKCMISFMLFSGAIRCVFCQLMAWNLLLFRRVFSRRPVDDAGTEPNQYTYHFAQF